MSSFDVNSLHGTEAYERFVKQCEDAGVLGEPGKFYKKDVYPKMTRGWADGVLDMLHEDPKDFAHGRGSVLLEELSEEFERPDFTWGDVAELVRRSGLPQEYFSRLDKILKERADRIVDERKCSQMRYRTGQDT